MAYTAKAPCLFWKAYKHSTQKEDNVEFFNIKICGTSRNF